MKRSWFVLTLLAAAGGLCRSAAAQEALSLDAAVANALSDNPTLRAAGAARDAALAAAQKTRPGFHPDIQVSVSQTVRGPELKFPKGATGQKVTVLPNHRLKLAAFVEQPLYQFGVGNSPQERYQGSVDAAKADYGKAELDLAREVREAYYTALQAQALEGVAAEAVTMAREQLRITRLLEMAGELAPLDVLKAEESLAGAESALLRARNGVRLAKANLNRLLSRPQGSDVTLVPVEGLPPDPPPTEELLPEAVRRRPEAAALRARIDTAEAGVRLARLQRLPRLTAAAGYELQNPSAFVPTSQWEVGLGLSAPIFETTGIRSDVRQAQEGVAQAEAGLQALEQGIALEIEQARLSLIEAKERLRVAERTVATARETRRVTQLLQEAGLATLADVEGTNLALTRAEGQRQQAIDDAWLADVRLRRALGLPVDED